jgi:hypothetical protein
MSEPSKDRMIVTLNIADLERIVEAAVERALANGTQHPVEKETWLTPEQAAATIGVNKERVYRYAKQWTFAKKISRKALRINEAGLRRWLAARK